MATRSPEARLSSRPTVHADPIGERSVHSDPTESRPDIKAFVEAWKNSVIPDIPKDAIPGYSFFWATTTNSSDSVEQRSRLGYKIVMREDLPASLHYLIDQSGRQTNYPGAITCNELLLMMIPTELKEAALLHFNHKEPYEFQKHTYSEIMQGAMDAKGKARASISEGILELEQEARKVNLRPTFTT